MKKKHTVRNRLLILLAVIIVAVPLYSIISGYIASRPKLNFNYNTSQTEVKPAYPDARFAVISDLHYYDTSLGTSGPAYEACLKSDRKLLKESGSFLDMAVAQIIQSKVQFVLVTGDLTKDGEKIGHEHVAAALEKLTQHGIKVYVVPGNHDINNPGSVEYAGQKSVAVPNVTADEFAQIYKGCGFDSAVLRDSSSLSYVAEPVQGLWLVALDTCRYADNKPGSEEIVSGRLTQDEEKWLEGVLKKANESGKDVIVMEHHGVVEHWKGQSRLHPDYLVSDYPYVGKLLASYNVRLAFTGHYHAQDITKGNFGGSGSLYDIETGSLVTCPCPVRICSISDNRLIVTTQDLIGRYKPGTDFEKNARAFVHQTIYLEAFKTLKKYRVSDGDAKIISDYVAYAFDAHYNGDENPANRPILDESRLSLWGRIIYSQEKYVVDGLWKDLPPQDNNAVIDLK